MKKSKNIQPRVDRVITPAGEEFFTTTDLGIAAALLTANFELRTLDKSDSHKVKFLFSREENISKVADDFWSNRLEQKSRSFWDNIKTLKNRLYSNDQ